MADRKRKGFRFAHPPTNPHPNGKFSAPTCRDLLFATRLPPDSRRAMTELPHPVDDLTATPLPAACDGTLMRRFRAGDEAAAELLFRRYAARLRSLANGYCANGYAQRFDGDDIVQTVFRVFFDGVRRERYDAEQNREVWSLLRVLAIHKVREKVKYHRATKRDVQRTASPDGGVECVSGSDDGESALLRLILDEQLAALPVTHRQVVLLRLDGHEVKEIVERTGQPQRTVERVLQKFRDGLGARE